MAKTDRSWLKPPPIMVVSGNHTFLREREVRRAQWAAMKTKRQINTVDGEDTVALSSFLSGSVLFTQESMVFVDTPEETDLALLQSHQDSDDGDTCLVLHHQGKINGRTKFGKFVAKLPKWVHREFLELPAYKAQEQAVAFCVAEAKQYRKTMDTKLANLLVNAIGTDLGVLSYEVLKASVYADALGDKESITSDHIRKTVSTIGEGNVVPIMEAIGQGNGPAVLRAMGKLRASMSGDPTMLVVSWLGRNASQWLHTAALLEMGIDSNSAAHQVGVPPYVYDRFVVPVAKRWGQDRLVALIKKVSSVERAVKTSAISPWVMLECAVFSSCAGVSRRG